MIPEFREVLVDIIEDIKPISKKSILDRFRTSSKRDSVDIFYDGYKEAVDEYIDNSVHAKARFPERLFRDIAPNQSQDELDYIRKTYECVTRDVFLEMSNTVKRSIPNGTIEWPKGGDDTPEEKDFKEYMYSKLPIFKSIDTFISILVDTKLEDSNAVIAVTYDWDKHIIITETEDSIIKTLNDELRDPKVSIYNSDKVVFNHDELTIVISHDKSIVDVGGKNVREGYIFIGFTNDRYYVATQYGKYDEFKFEIEEIPHAVGYKPCTRTKGLPKLNGDNLMFSSPFNIAVPDLNLAVLDSANLLIIKRKVGYPTRVFLAQPCQHQENGSHCNEGTISWSDGKGKHEMECPACKGAGLVSVFGPQSELMINADRNGPDDPKITASEAMAYVSPNIDTPKFLREEINEFIKKAERILHLKAEPRKSGNITATEKNQDAKNTEAFIKPISDQIWDLIAFLFDTSGLVRYSSEVYEGIKPKFIAPSDFDLIKPEDYIEQIAEARKNGIPEVVIASLMYNMLRSQSYSDSESMMAFELIEKSDRLLTLTESQVTTKLARGLIQPYEVTLHDSSLFIIMSLLREDNKFFDKEEEEQIEAMIELAKEITIEAQDSIDTLTSEVEEF